MSSHSFGRVDANGNVFCIEDGVERHVGQYADVSAEEAMAFYVRKFDDINTALSLFERRVASDAAHSDLTASLAKIKDQVTEGIGVGDFAALRTRIETLSSTIEKKMEELSEQSALAREEAIASRTALVEKVEALASGDLTKVQWKQMTANVDELFAQWQEAQKKDRKFPKATADDLWKRFRAARNTLDQARRKYFAELDQSVKGAKAAKEALITKAEGLMSQGASALTPYRALLEDWKKAPRGPKKVDDALWKRFKAAGDAIYAAKNEEFARDEAEYQGNLVVKLEILTEAELLLTATDYAQARSTLNGLQKRWDAAGKVPRAKIREVEDRMRKVETAVRKLEEAHWNKSNPEKQARSEGLAGQIESKIATLEGQLALAQSAGDAARVASIEDDIAAQRSWLAVLS
jgi:hypothetical protein